MRDAQHRDCPACGETAHATHVYAQRFTLPSANAIHAGYDVVVCDRCGLGYARNPPSQAFFDEYYGTLAKTDEMLDPAAGFAESDATIRRNDHSLTNIVPYVAAGQRVLEVGCYTGYLLSRIAAAVPGAQVVGLDPSCFAATIGRQRHGVDIRVGTIFDDLDLGLFDVVIAMHVLEHVVDPGAFVDRLRTFLAPQGTLYLEVPDAARFRSWPDSREQRAEPFFEFNFEHITYFTTGSLATLMRRFGFASIENQQQQSTLPIIASTWRTIDISPSDDVVPSRDALPQLQRYVAESNAIDATIAARITALNSRAADYIVWGAGAHTQRLLGAGLLDATRVRLFVDSNAAFRGAALAGKPIVAPAEVAAHPELPVLVSSHRFEREIAARIRAEGWPNEIVTLYEQGVENWTDVPSA